MTARKATEADLAVCLRMGREFTQAAGLDANEASMEWTLRTLMQGGGLFVIGEPVHGMAAGLIYDNYFNRSKKAAQELFWWIDPAHRANGAGGELMAALEAWAKEGGAATMTMVALDALDGERVSKMYARAGYVPLEHSHMKVL